MSYRKLELNGRIYEWVVGKDFLKVKGVGIWPSLRSERLQFPGRGLGTTSTL